MPPRPSEPIIHNVASLAARTDQHENAIHEIRDDLKNAVDKLGDKFDVGFREIANRLSDTVAGIYRKIDEKTAPNFATIASWATVALMVLSLAGGLVGMFYMNIKENDERDKQECLKAVQEVEKQGVQRTIDIEKLLVASKENADLKAHAIEEVNNVQWANQNRMNALSFEECNKRRYPSDGFYLPKITTEK